MIKGSYCCEAVKFELLTEPSTMGTCHCSRWCRDVGANTIVFVKTDDHAFVAEKPSWYEICDNAEQTEG